MPSIPHKAKRSSGKLSKDVVLYMPGSVLGLKVGAHCGDCWKFIGSESGPGECIEVEGDINPAHGVCGLFVMGRVFDGKKPTFSIEKVSKKIAGYVEKGPTHCDSCEYYEGVHEGTGPCEKVEGTVEFDGCCNQWDDE